MKRNIIKATVCTAMLACPLGAQAQNVSVKGQLKGFKSDSVLVYVIDPITEKRTKDTLVMKKGKFALSYPATHMTEVALYNMPNPNNRWNDGIFFYLIPNKPLVVNGTTEKFTVKGDAIYNKVNEYENGYAPIQAKLTQVNNAYDQKIKVAKTDEEKKAVRDKYFPEMRKYSDEICKNALDFIKQNPDNEACCIAIIQAQDFYEAYKLMTDRVKKCELAPAYKQYQNYADQKIKREAQEKKLDNGAEAPDFTLKDLNGNDFKLSSLRGKYVMLDFWGSWCGWCIKALPSLKECYNKHKDSGKFEIVSVDCNDTEAKWKAAVKQHDMTWTQVKSEKKDDIATLYGVPGYPSFIIINPEGKIIKRYVGSEPAMYTYIDSLFQ